MWKLQENALNKNDLLDLSNYILKKKTLTQGNEVKNLKEISRSGINQNILYL